MIPVAEARRFVLSACAPLAPRRIAVGDASGHVLAEKVCAAEAVPPFANSAMDGYALRATDTTQAPVRLRVVGTVMAGDDPTTLVAEGEAVRIMTGAPLPPGTDAVCMIERTRTEHDGSIVVVEESVDPEMHVRHAGEDIAAGAEVFAPGTLLTPPHIGVLASLGIETVPIHPRPRVGVISTGDELTRAPGALQSGKIRDANRPALLAQLRAEGWDAVDLGIVGDDETALAHMLEDCVSTCDALVTSGGVSVGERDVVRVVLDKQSGGTMRWMQVAVKPAKPFAFGMLASSGTPVFGLPGNPVSALVSYELFVRPALRTMAGCLNRDRPCLSATTEVDLRRRRDGKLHLLRVLASAGTDGALRVRLSGGQDSHMLRAMAYANALAVLPDGEGVSAGGRVDILLLDAERIRLPGDERPW